MSWTPTTLDVADILHTRTTNRAGVELGNFVNDPNGTKPNNDQVIGRIAKGMADVAGRVGPIPDPLSFIGSLSYDDALIVENLAKTAATYRAAMLVELTYFPEQIDSGRSPYVELKALYDEALANLSRALSEFNQSGEVEPGGGAGDPSYSFPEDEGGMIGWGTRW